MNRRLLAFFLIASVFASSPLLAAQVQVEQTLSDQQLWTDGIYYLKIGRMEFAQAYLEAYVDRQVEPAKTLEFSEADPRASQILIRLQANPDLGSLAQELLNQIDQGWLTRRQDIARIQNEIERLAGTPRAQFHAVERLKEAGEYAVPVILPYLADPDYSSLHAKLVDSLVALGPRGLEPLLAAVLDLPDRPKMLVIRALGGLDYAQAIPYLKQIIEDPDSSDPVKSSASNALNGILSRNPRHRDTTNAAESFYQLALRYYVGDSSVQPASDSRQVTALAPDIAADRPNIWLWENGELVPQSVPWELYYELMAMRMTRKSLQLDNAAGHRDALTLWLMANSRRESRLSDLVADPLHDELFPTAHYFFQCAGTRYGLDALARSLNDSDVALSIAALEALREISSGNDILAATAGTQPIVNALSQEHQLVRNYAALALGWASPSDSYLGMDRVVPLLGNILTEIQNPRAVLIIPNDQRRESFADDATELGYEALAAESFDAASKHLSQDPQDIELIILDYRLTTPSIDQAVKRIRENTFLKLVPVLVIVEGDQIENATIVLADQPGLAFVSVEPSLDIIEGRVDYLRRQLGRVALDDEQHHRNALSAVLALERLAQNSRSSYDVEQARDPLVKIAGGTNWTLAYPSARVLSLLSSQEAQQSLAKIALNRTSADEQVVLLNLLGESIRANGNKLTTQQVAQLQEKVIRQDDPSIREATAKVLGALNLEPKVARNVILERESFGQVGQ